VAGLGALDRLEGEDADSVDGELIERFAVRELRGIGDGGARHELVRDLRTAGRTAGNSFRSKGPLAERRYGTQAAAGVARNSSGRRSGHTEALSRTADDLACDALAEQLEPTFEDRVAPLEIARVDVDREVRSWIDSAVDTALAAHGGLVRQIEALVRLRARSSSREAQTISRLPRSYATALRRWSPRSRRTSTNSDQTHLCKNSVAAGGEGFGIQVPARDLRQSSERLREDWVAVVAAPAV
jgi:hypothetical protein